MQVEWGCILSKRNVARLESWVNIDADGVYPWAARKPASLRIDQVRKGFIFWVSRASEKSFFLCYQRPPFLQLTCHIKSELSVNSATPNLLQVTLLQLQSSLSLREVQVFPFLVNRVWGGVTIWDTLVGLTFRFFFTYPSPTKHISCFFAAWVSEQLCLSCSFQLHCCASNLQNLIKMTVRLTPGLAFS